MARPQDSERAKQLKEFMETYRKNRGGQWPSDYAINKQFGWGAGVITRIRQLLAKQGVSQAAESPQPDRADQAKTEIFNQLEQVLRPVVDTLYEHTLGREQRTREQLNERLRERGQTLERISKELAEARITIQTHKETIDQQLSELSAQTQRIKDRETDLEHRNQEIERLNRRIEELTSSQKRLQATESRLLDQLESLHQSHLQQRELDRQSAQQEKQDIQKTLLDTQTELRGARTEIVTLSDLAKKEHQRYLSERSNFTKMQDQARQARDTAESAQAERAALLERVTKMEQDLISANHTRELMATKMQSLEETNTHLTQALAAKEELNVELKASLARALTHASENEDSPRDPGEAG